MSKIKITGDSTIDMSKELLEKYNVDTVPLYINLGDEALKDGAEVTPDDIYKFVCETGKLPKTSAPSIQDYIDFFTKHKAEHDYIIHFNISSEFSSAYQNACAAARQFEGVYVVDSRNLSTGSALPVIRACEMAEGGTSPDDIALVMPTLCKNVKASFIINRLDYLYKGGRCSGVAALGANLLKLKPSILVEEGKMGVGKKYRGHYNSCMEAYLRDQIENRSDIIADHVFITHTKCDNETIELAKKVVRECLPTAVIHETTAGCTITSHCGPETLGVLFITE